MTRAGDFLKAVWRDEQSGRHLIKTDFEGKVVLEEELGESDRQGAIGRVEKEKAKQVLEV